LYISQLKKLHGMPESLNIGHQVGPPSALRDQSRFCVLVLI